MKKVLSYLLAFVLIVGVIPFGTITVGANSYDSSAAVSYALSHYNNGVGECAEFVSNCLSAGGCSAWNKNCDNLLSALTNGNYGTLYQLTAASNGKIYFEDNLDKVSIGDPIFFYCSTCQRYVHAAIVTSSENINNKSEVICCAHNYATNHLNYLKTYYHTVNGVEHKNVSTVYSFHMSVSSTPPTPTVTEPKGTWTFSNQSVSKNAVSFHAKFDLTNYNPSYVTEIMGYIYNSSDKVLSKCWDEFPSLKASPMYFQGDYTLNYSFSPCTTYKYALEAYYGSINKSSVSQKITFTTPGYIITYNANGGSGAPATQNVGLM